ncbi:MAG: dihydrodipicolinate synthase family protein [Actinomycetia bacterium]|nr:dihydrodipicolinate synthase family protein [Actinomycetes bacterium]
MARKMEKGFITALGTPRDKDGYLIEESLTRHVIDQINGGVHGFLVLGTMGDEPGIKDSEYARVVKTVVEAKEENNPDARILVGAMDNSIERVMDRINNLKGLDIDGIALTTPYYFGCSQGALIRFFSTIADRSQFPIYLYDLPSTTKTKIMLETQKRLSEHKNIWGSKCSEDADYIRKLAEYFKGNEEYAIIEAQFDLFDMFHRIGLKLHLDGFTCLFPQWLKSYWNDLESEKWDKCTLWQAKFTELRDEFIKLDVFSSFSYAMNLLGYRGNFAPSHFEPVPDDIKDKIKDLMKKFELI